MLSEGLNLQDATRLINYDLHWNPVRLMQRIGRVDRRMNPEVEARIVADHPDQEKLRGAVAYWNFLPPDELDELLRLYNTVTTRRCASPRPLASKARSCSRRKTTTRRSRNFTDAYEGSLSPTERMHLELQTMLNEHPDLEARLNGLPNRVFSGKENLKPGTQAVFFCYALPGKQANEEDPDEPSSWSLEAGYVQWYLYDLASENILEYATEIVDYIRATPDTPRHCVIEQGSLKRVRETMDKHVKNTYLKKVQAPIGVEPVLKTWMELN